LPAYSADLINRWKRIFWNDVSFLSGHCQTFVFPKTCKTITSKTNLTPDGKILS
jgi:hypothetical protein